MKTIFIKIWEFIKTLIFGKPKQEFIIIDNINDWKLIELGILLEINKYRSKLGLKQLIAEVNLKNEANIRGEYILDVGKITHEYFNLTNGRLLEVGFKHVGEILASGQDTAIDVVDAWKSSLNHHPYIINSKYEYIGVSMTQDKRRKYFCVIFGK